MNPLRLLSNASITVKSLLSTLIGVLVVIAMAAIGVSSLIEVRAADEMQGAAVDLMSQARDGWIDLSRGQAALYRSINLKSQNVEVALVRAAKIDALAAIGRAKKALASLKITDLPIDAQLAAKANKSVADYAGSAEQAATFVEDDAFNATMFMSDAELKFATAQQDVSALVTTAIELEGALGEQMVALEHSRLVTIAVGAGIAVVLLLVISTLLSRMISRPIVEMTAGMRRIAGGDLTTEIRATDRKDEVGQMAQALLVFRQNAQEARALHVAADKEHAQKARRQASMDRHPGLRYIGGGCHGESCQFRRVDAPDRDGDDGGRAKDTSQRGAGRGRCSDINDQPGCGVGSR